MPYLACPQGHGDLNQDGVIDDRDGELFTKSGCYLKKTATYSECVPYDLNGDGIVNTLDWSLLIQLAKGYDPFCKLQLTEIRGTLLDRASLPVTAAEELPPPVEEKELNWPLIGGIVAVTGGILYVLTREGGKK